jgi:hypothetical protein
MLHVLIYAFLLIWVTESRAQETNPPIGGCRSQSDDADCRDAFVFFHKLKTAISGDQRQQVAEMVRYPISVLIDNKSIEIPTAQAFLVHYDEIINPAEHCAIATAQDVDVWSNAHGYTIDRGAIWWERLTSNPEENPRQEIDWSKIPFKLVTVNNINVVAKGCMELNVVQVLSLKDSAKGHGIVIRFPQAYSFFSHFQKALANNERERVAEMMRYPLELRMGGRSDIVRGKDQFLELYDSILGAKTKKTLLSESSDDLEAWWEGIADSKDLLQFSPIANTDDFLITMIADSPAKSAPQ